MLNVQIKKNPGAKTPFNNPEQTDAGYDLYYHTNDRIYQAIYPGERVLFNTGISISIPEGYYGQIVDRSGNAVKKGIHVMAGVIDSGYLGEIKVLLVNLSTETAVINKDDKIAQIIFKQYEKVNWEEVSELVPTNRAEKGFGSSDNKG